MEINIYTDGAASPNPGRGGGAAIIQWEHKGVKYQKEYQIYEEESTNQRMEIGAALKGLLQANIDIQEFMFDLQPEEVREIETKPIYFTVYSDSAYVVNCINQKWYINWEKNGWLNAKKQPVANRELWEVLIAIIDDIVCADENIVDFVKVKGHSNNELNNAVDALAVEARKYLIDEDINNYLWKKED